MSRYCVAANDCISLAFMIPNSLPPTLAKTAQGWGTLSCDGVGKKRNSEATGSAIKQVPPLRFASVGMTGFGDW